jgi:uncharacterized protein
MFTAAYSPLQALAGGCLIGLASLLVILATGRPLGISGFMSRVLLLRPGDWAWRLVFFAGLLVGAWAAFQFIESATAYRSGRSLAALAVAGVLVGFGTRLSNGCTSGHGVCGLSLGSKSSLVATLVFMGAGMVTVFVLRYVGGGLNP